LRFFNSSLFALDIIYGLILLIYAVYWGQQAGFASSEISQILGNLLSKEGERLYNKAEHSPVTSYGPG
jgi:hypothetical protein